MAFTGQLGTNDSQLGNILLGDEGGGGASTVVGSFTADAFVQLFFTADACIAVNRTGSFTADAVIVVEVWADDFNRSVALGLGDRYYDQNSAYGYGSPSTASVNGSEVLAPPNPGFGSNFGGFSAPLGSFSIVRYDFYVPADVDANVYYEIDVAGYLNANDGLYYNRWLFAYPNFDTTWTYGVDSDDIFTFSPDASTWYTVKAFFPTNFDTEFQRVKVWKRGDPEPAWTITSAQLGPAASRSGIYDQVGSIILNPDVEDQFLDNFYILDGGSVEHFPFISADAVIAAAAGTTVGSFTADAIKKATQSSSFSANAFILGYFTANAVIVVTHTGSFTGNAWKSKTQVGSFSANAVIPDIFRYRHARDSVEHTGVDHDLDHLIWAAFDHYLRGDDLQDVLADLNDRVTALERRTPSRFNRIYGSSVFKKTPTPTFSADASLLHPFPVTLDAFIGYYVTAYSLILPLGTGGVSIADATGSATDWAPTLSPKMATIRSTSLTWSSGDDPDWWFGPGEAYLSGWAKVVLGSTQTVRIDTENTQGDSVIELWSGSPGAWPSDPIATGDDNFGLSDPTNPYGFSEVIEESLAAGTYWVLIHPFDQSPPDPFHLVLRIRLI